MTKLNEHHENCKGILITLVKSLKYEIFFPRHICIVEVLLRKKQQVDILFIIKKNSDIRLEVKSTFQKKESKQSKNHEKAGGIILIIGFRGGVYKYWKCNF